MSDSRRPLAPPAPTHLLVRVPEFRWIVVASAQSQLGDQLARVALSILIFHQTDSPALAAGAYALTMLPEIIGGLILGPLADLCSRRALLVATDLLRAALVAAMALPGVSIPWLCVLLVAAVLIGSPFDATQSAMLVDVLDDADYGLGAGLRSTVAQVAQLIGFGVGGVLVALTSARTALALDAATFLASAVIIRLAVRRRPPARQRSTGPVWSAGFRAMHANPRLPVLTGLAWLVGYYVTPEGLAAPLARDTHTGSWGVGLLLAGPPAGAALGTYLFSRLNVPGNHPRGAFAQRWLPAAVLLAAAPLVLCFLHPGFVGLLALLTLTGLFSGYMIVIQIEFNTAAPAATRGQLVAIVGTGLVAAQGLAILLGGLLATVISAESTVACAGVAAVLTAAPLLLARRRQRRT